MHDLRDGKEARPKYLSSGAGLLYPSEHARRLDELAPEERPEQLVVLDGTWPHAHTLYDQNPWLEALPHFTLPPGPESNYRIRKEPRPSYLSTVEAVFRALSILEPQTPGLASLQLGFTQMIDRQMKHVGHPRQRLRPRAPFGRLPPLEGQLQSLVLVHIEHSGHPDPELIHIGALRLCDEKTLSLVLRPQKAISERRILHMGLALDRVMNGLSLDATQAAMAEFIPVSGVVASWRQNAAVMLIEQLGRSDAVIGLKTMYANHRAATGSLHAVAKRESLSAEPIDVPGRVGQMLPLLRAVAEFLAVASSRDRAVGASEGVLR